MEILLLAIAVLATTIGAISGMGGGIIIKPAMDAISGLDTSVINYMSGCTVLVMAVVSIWRGRKDDIDIDYKISGTLAVGACVGGVLGSMMFDQITGNAALIQSTMLFFLNVGIYAYVKVKHKLKTLQIENLALCLLIGGGLGTISSFLGIGGGPINIAVLYFFFSSRAKVTAKRSIFIILLSQISSFVTTAVTGVPEGVNYIAMCLMMLGGCTGAVLGGKISKKLSDSQVDSLFIDVLVAIIALNAFNIGKLI